MHPDIDQGDLGLRRSLGYRLSLAIAAAPTLFFAIIGLSEFSSFVGPGRGLTALLLKVFVGELFVAMLVVSVLSLIWALATPRWIEKLVARHVFVLQLGILLFIPGFFVLLHCIGI